MTYFSLADDGLILHCHIQPKASRDAIVGIHNDRLKIQITAAPTDGKANAHLCRFVGKAAGVAKTRVALVKGQTGRQKTLLIAGLRALPACFPATEQN